MEETLDIREAIVIRPGDTLIVRVESHSTLARAAEIRNALLKRLPGVAEVLVLSAEGLAVYRPEATP